VTVAAERRPVLNSLFPYGEWNTPNEVVYNNTGNLFSAPPVQGPPNPVQQQTNFAPVQQYAPAQYAPAPQQFQQQPTAVNCAAPVNYAPQVNYPSSPLPTPQYAPVNYAPATVPGSQTFHFATPTGPVAYAVPPVQQNVQGFVPQGFVLVPAHQVAPGYNTQTQPAQALPVDPRERSVVVPPVPTNGR
jgi:hypothetical protein